MVHARAGVAITPQPSHVSVTNNAHRSDSKIAAMTMAPFVVRTHNIFKRKLVNNFKAQSDPFNKFI